jgi:hypothetical protein
MNFAPELVPNSHPVSEIDPYSNGVLIDPWKTYAELQRLGSAVWLTKHQMFALTRYDSVVRALKDFIMTPDAEENVACAASSRSHCPQQH